MFEFIQDDNFLNDEHKSFINEIILGEDFAWFHKTNSIQKDDCDKYLSHIVVRRPEVNNGKSEINSPYFDNMVKLLSAFTNKHNIRVNELLSCRVNLTYNNDVEKCKLHRDHRFEHKQLLICLNDPTDKEAYTVILGDDEKTEYKRIAPKQYQGIYYNNQPHYQFYPKSGYRVMVVYTFT